MMLDEDLEKLLDGLWKKKPEVTVDYAKIKSTLLLVQELRNLHPKSAVLQQSRINLSVIVAEKPAIITTETLEGKIMHLASEGYLNDWRSEAEMIEELSNHGWTFERLQVARAIASLVSQFYLGSKRTDKNLYKLSEFVTFVREA
jgi:hypothetical protein